MNTPFRIGLSILLSALILLSGSGMAFGKMTCVKSGHTKYALGELSDCCGKEEQAKLHAPCCEIHHVVFAQNHFVPEGAAVIKAAFPVKVFTGTFALVAVPEQHFTFCDGSTTDPPLLPQEQSPQSFFSVFRI